MPSNPSGSAPSPLIWLAIAVAFSPVVVELARHVANESHDLYVCVAPLLLAILAFRRDAPRVAPRRRLATALLALALGLELVGFASWSFTLARLGLAMAVMGGGLWTGLWTPRAGLLSFGMVPLPTSVVTLATPALESGLVAFAASLAELVGAQVESSGPLLFLGGERLEVQPQENGARLAVVLAQLGWYARQRQPQRSLLADLALVSGLALLALPLQAVGLVLALGLLSVAGPSLSVLWLHTGLWLGVALIGLLWIETRRRAAPNGAAR